MARSVNIAELSHSDRWTSFLESTAAGLQLELLIISQDEKLSLKVPTVCPGCQAVFAPNFDINRIPSNPNGVLQLENGFSAFTCSLKSGLVMLAAECQCMRDKIHPSLANRGQVAAKLLNSFQMALSEGIEGGHRAVELSTLRQLNHLVLSLCQGDEHALNNTFDLILSAVIILLDAVGSWLEFSDPKLPTLIIIGDEESVAAARSNPLLLESFVIEIGNQNVGKLGVVLPSDIDQASVLLPLMAEECVIAVEIHNLFRLLNKQLNQVLGAAACAVLLIDKRLEITFANKRAEVLMKRSHIDLLGSSISNWKGPWLAYLNSETCIPVRGEMEYFPCDTDPADPCWVDWQLSPLLEGSTIMGWLLLIDDRTDYYRWQEAARQAERFAATATMVGALAHEMRNPISAATGLLQLMGRKRDPEQTRNYTNLVLRELDRVTSLLNEFLLLGKPANIEIEPLDPAAFLRDLLPLFQGEADGLEVELILDIDPTVSTIAADSGQLTQVMLNLVRNAIQAVSRCGQVTVCLRERNGLVCIDVIDNGPGLTPEALNNLFRPFFTTKERGTGLGLPVVQAIMHNHGGKIVAANNPEGGAIFSLSFQATKKGTDRAVDVLIAMDDKMFTHPVEQALISAGFKVRNIINLEQAMKEAQLIYPSVVMTMVSDGQKSEEAVAACRLLWPNVKILLLKSALRKSARSESVSDISLAGNIQSVDYLEYPVELTRVVSSIQRMLIG